MQAHNAVKRNSKALEMLLAKTCLGVLQYYLIIEYGSHVERKIMVDSSLDAKVPIMESFLV